MAADPRERRLRCSVAALSGGKFARSSERKRASHLCPPRCPSVTAADRRREAPVPELCKMARKRPRERRICAVCQAEDADAKYRCPRCPALYCSVTCCREHKAVCPSAAASTGEPERKEVEGRSRSRSSSESGQETHEAGERLQRIRKGQERTEAEILEEAETFGGLTWKLSEDHKARLLRDASLRKQLKSSRLAEVIVAVDEADDREKALAKMRAQNRDFAGFIDEMLLSVGLAERDSTGFVQFTG
eukprot:scaffold952_cov249-Pinguiococcus_pyrenoidosus.AAC.22